MNYGEAIKKLREKMIVSQGEFAKIVGASVASVNRWEKGFFEPTIKTKRKLAKLFEKYEIKII